MDQVRVQQIHVSFIISNGNTSQLIQMFANCKLNKSHKDKNKKAYVFDQKLLVKVNPDSLSLSLSHTTNHQPKNSHTEKR